jgi:heme-degrading monooxygenase HmoA
MGTVMILETAVFSIRPEEAEAFLAAFAQGRRFIETSRGFRRLELRRGIEQPGTFILVVWWESLEDHTVAFKQSSNFDEWRAVVGHFFAAPPVVHHYSEGV